jgi:HK97 family phage portal protein
MQLFGLTITKAAPAATLVPVRSYSSSFLSTIRESFTGAWQKNIEIESPQNILAFSAVYTCVSLIADDISTLRIKLTESLPDGTWPEVETGSPWLPVYRKPNRYQTRIQFLSQWITSKLLTGNTYILKERDDQRKIVTSLYILNPERVKVLVGEDGSVYYKLRADALAGLKNDELILPAKEIIHDRMNTLWHPLVGVSPIYASGSSATQGIRIQNNSAKFFENMSRPSGHLMAPGVISKETIESLKQQFNENFGGGNLGKLMVTGDNLKYEPMTIPANDAQLIEQLRWTVEDVARCFHVPLHKLGMGQPTLNNIAALNQDYYNLTLRKPIEDIELLLDEGLELPTRYYTELDLDGLLRMDPLSRADVAVKLIGAGVMAPNEHRLKENLPPVKGGESPLIQQQNYSLEALAKRDAKDDPFASATPARRTSDAPAEPMPAAEPTKSAPEFNLKHFADTFIRGFANASA